MNYSAKITKKSIENNLVRVWIELSKGTKVVKELDFTVTDPAQITPFVKREIEIIEKQDAFIKDENTDLDLSGPVVSTPTQNELDEKLFYEKLELLREKKLYVDLGLLADSDIKSLKDELVILGKKIKEL